MFYVYVIKSSVDSMTYTGYTNDLKRRFVEHNRGKNVSTRPRNPFTLVYYEAYVSQADALRREKQLKKFAGARTALKRRIPGCLR